jgi:hypothetical protein
MTNKTNLSFLLLLMIITSTFTGFISALTISPQPENLDFNTNITSDKIFISKWGGISTITIEKPTINDFTDFTIETTNDPNGIEMNIILNSIPPINTFSYPLTLKNVNFYYQPPFDSKDYPTNWIVNSTHVYDDKGILIENRPINVVGSYAVYGIYKDNDFGTGKITHIYRPLIWDSEGKHTWGDLNYSNNTLTVTVDQKWLESAKYPVTVDPAFGNTNAGASSFSVVSSDYLYGCEVTTPATTTMSMVQMVAYVKRASGTGAFKAGLWANTDGGANVVLSSASETVPGDDTFSWKAAVVAPFAVTPSTTYQIAIIGSTAILQVAYDDGAGVGHRDIGNSYASPTVFDWSSDNTYLLSLYAVYNIQTATITDMDDTDNLYAMKKYYTFSIDIYNYEGATDIKEISIRGAQGASVRWSVAVTGLNAATGYAYTSGIDVDTASCTFTETGNVGTLVLKIRFHWDITNEENCELEVWSKDVDDNEIAWEVVQSDYFDVITRLTSYQFGSNLTNPTLGATITMSGYIRYCTTYNGLTSSSSYPPDAQFTSVEIHDNEDNVAGTDIAIVNGFFSADVIAAAVVQTTPYHIYLNLVPNYVDGDAPDGDIVYIYTRSDFYFSDLLDQVFNLFGIPNIVTTVSGMIVAIGTRFVESTVMILSSISTIATMVFNFSVFFFDWTSRMATFILNVAEIVINVFNGTQTGIGTIIDWWTILNINTLITVIPLFLFIYWLSSLDERVKTQGQSILVVAYNDLQIFYGIFSILTNFAWTIFNFVYGTARGLLDLIL